ncbi:hypothetical protein CPLU01_03491 [Colletotrichum plurivorum]|uniref:Uncharacterized protein n=1 Tax=Colletotrichum plurivorum TaxID=2175906 RepID=A0A8H6KS76_9PEZI|nr:hypothetical protein CPLU01_03491 [Colletotrichum plurivorum]
MKDNEKKPAKPGKGRGNQPARSISLEEVAANIHSAINNCPANNNQRRIALQSLLQVTRNSIIYRDTINDRDNKDQKRIMPATQQKTLELIEQDQPDEGRMNKYRDRHSYSEWFALILRRNFSLPPNLLNSSHVQNHYNQLKAIHDGLEVIPGSRPGRGNRSNRKSSRAATPLPQTQATNANNVSEERSNLMGGDDEEDRMAEERFRPPSNIDTSSYLTSAPSNSAMTSTTPHSMGNFPIPPGHQAQYPQYHGYQPSMAHQYQFFAPSNTPVPLQLNAQPVGRQVPTQQWAASRQTIPQQPLPQPFPPQPMPQVFPHQHLPGQRPSQHDIRRQHLLQQYSAQQSDARQLTRELEAQQRRPHQSNHLLSNLSNSSNPSIMSNSQPSTPYQAPTPTLQAYRPPQANHVPSNVPNPSSPAATVNPDRFMNNTQYPYPTVDRSLLSLPPQADNELNNIPSSPNPVVDYNMNTHPVNDDQSSSPTMDAGTSQPTVATPETDDAGEAELQANMQILVSRPPPPMPVATEYPRQPANRAHDADNKIWKDACDRG